MNTEQTANKKLIAQSTFDLLLSVDYSREKQARLYEELTRTLLVRAMNQLTEGGRGMTVAIGAKDYVSLRRAYEKALKNNDTIMVWKGETLVLSFVYYVLEFIASPAHAAGLSGIYRYKARIARPPKPMLSEVL